MSGKMSFSYLFYGEQPSLSLGLNHLFVLGLESEYKSKVAHQLKAVDLGGHRIVRRVMKDYNAKVDGIVYVVNAAEKEKFAESKKELDALLSDDSLAQVPFLILGTIPDGWYVQVQIESSPIMVHFGPPASEDELRKSLGLSNYTTGKGKVNRGETNKRPIEVFMWYTGQKMVCKEGFKWLSQYIK
ncbi:unnamed protein product [Sphagnum balticum]